MPTPGSTAVSKDMERPAWRDVLAPYARAHLGRSLLDIATSVLPYVTLWALMYLALDVSYLLVLALAIPAGGFLLRTFIVFHDCAHGSFLPSKRANAWLGATLGLAVFQAGSGTGSFATRS
jgi:omega-6 fatty acid desaturase (delta-12 desaturase)